jgi:hypothetical protein
MNTTRDVTDALREDIQQFMHNERGESCFVTYAYDIDLLYAVSASKVYVRYTLGM